MFIYILLKDTPHQLMLVWNQMIVLDGKYVHFILDFNNVISMSVRAGVERLYVYVSIAFNISDY